LCLSIAASRCRQLRTNMGCSSAGTQNLRGEGAWRLVGVAQRALLLLLLLLLLLALLEPALTC
jgi:hypothetical protein